jgi:hypothetical protein
MFGAKCGNRPGNRLAAFAAGISDQVHLAERPKRTYHEHHG